MATHKQIEANRKNSKRSTGPRSERGRATVAGNALKHGLTGAGKVLPPDVEEALHERTAAWAEDLGVRDSIELHLVEQAALAAIRAERCAAAELRADARKGRQAARRQTTRHISAVERLGRTITKDPEVTAARLQSTPEGCDWLARRWVELAFILATHGHWPEVHLRQALELMGRRPDGRGGLDLIANDLRVTNEVARRAVEPDPRPRHPEVVDRERRLVAALARTYEAHDTPRLVEGHDRRWQDARAARTALDDLVTTRVAALKARRRELEAEGGPPQADDPTPFDAGPASKRFRGYEASLARQFHQAIDQVRKLRKALPDEKGAKPEPRPEEATAPSAAPLDEPPPSAEPSPRGSRREEARGADILAALVALRPELRRASPDGTVLLSPEMVARDAPAEAEAEAEAPPAPASKNKANFATGNSPQDDGIRLIAASDRPSHPVAPGVVCTPAPAPNPPAGGAESMHRPRSGDGGSGRIHP